MLIVTAFIVGVFYCLDALYGERRDRSICLEIAVPVSDSATFKGDWLVVSAAGNYNGTGAVGHDVLDQRV